MSKTYDEASDVSQEEGSVKVVGPDGVDVKLTPRAALKIAGRLDEAALDALIDEANTAGQDQPQRVLRPAVSRTPP